MMSVRFPHNLEMCFLSYDTRENLEKTLDPEGIETCASRPPPTSPAHPPASPVPAPSAMLTSVSTSVPPDFGQDEVQILSSEGMRCLSIELSPNVSVHTRCPAPARWPSVTWAPPVPGSYHISDARSMRYPWCLFRNRQKVKPVRHREQPLPLLNVLDTDSMWVISQVRTGRPSVAWPADRQADKGKPKCGDG